MNSPLTSEPQVKRTMHSIVASTNTSCSTCSRLRCQRRRGLPLHRPRAVAFGPAPACCRYCRLAQIPCSRNRAACLCPATATQQTWAHWWRSGLCRLATTSRLTGSTAACRWGMLQQRRLEQHTWMRAWRGPQAASHCSPAGWSCDQRCAVQPGGVLLRLHAPAVRGACSLQAWLTKLQWLAGAARDPSTKSHTCMPKAFLLLIFYSQRYFLAAPLVPRHQQPLNLLCCAKPPKFQKYSHNSLKKLSRLTKFVSLHLWESCGHWLGVASVFCTRALVSSAGMRSIAVLLAACSALASASFHELLPKEIRQATIDNFPKLFSLKVS